jgi:hypothetical protein
MPNWRLEWVVASAPHREQEERVIPEAQKTRRPLVAVALMVLAPMVSQPAVAMAAAPSRQFISQPSDELVLASSSSMGTSSRIWI